MAKMSRLQYDVAGARMRLPEAHRIGAGLYLVITVGLGLAVAATNVGNQSLGSEK